MGSGLLGRGLISAKPKADGGPFDEGQIVCRELVIPRRNPSALFDLVEEPLNKIARATEVRAEADGVPAIAFGRDVCPCTLIVNKRPDPVGLMATVGKHHRLRAQSGQEYWAKPIVVSLAGREIKAQRQATGVHHSVHLAGQSAARPTHVLISVPGKTGSVLMNPHNGCIDHLHCRNVGGCQGFHDLVPNACSSPADKAVVGGRGRSVARRQITPWRTRPQDPEHAVENTPVARTRHAARLVWKHRLDHCPFMVIEFRANDSRLTFGNLIHVQADPFNGKPPCP